MEEGQWLLSVGEKIHWEEVVGVEAVDMGIISDSCDMEFRSVNETLEYCNILCIARMRLYCAP